MNPTAEVMAAKPRRQFRLWIPFLVVWALLLPFVLLLAPVVFLACLVAQVDPIRGVSVYWQIFSSLRGLRVDVEDPNARIRLN